MYYRNLLPYLEVEQYANAIAAATPPLRKSYRRRRWWRMVASLVLAPGAALLKPWI
jgi:hypothetical protein